MSYNRYSHTFVAMCPNNGAMIVYHLVIEMIGIMIPVEKITEATTRIKEGYHEDIADELFALFGGSQVLKAHHHGVDIETIRENM